MHSTKEVLNI